ncbi:mono/diheme cytochrome c family protein [Inquilinus ginsengisoli]|uniref:Mono/diheme cytochrome c family protein n=1 Tax=Inquilinus ginsengisoli TaxID=363840 RepID=A0ABU1JNF8_9PROT|nr:cytochrome c [Inquilinus ginsengisoli]MDR6290148.1 mono/diheme cytochrome c family protein [Inquilinus ginsengisoli]
MRAAIAGAAIALALGIAAARADDHAFETVEKGRYLTILGGCAACHTVPGGTPFAGGRAIETPFGDVLATNITPDRETGIGGWTDDEFVRALQEGIGRDGEHLYPALPYTAYTKVERDDLLAIRAYLDTLDPVRNPVEPNQLSFPFDMRLGMRGWNLLYFTAGPLKPRPDKPAEWNRGAALVEGLGHCGSCHTAKSWFGGDDTGAPLRGGALQGWFAPDITADRHVGIGDWSTAQIVEYLKTGRNERVAASGPMAEVVALSTSRMTDADLAAIATYLKDQPGAGATGPRPLAATDKRMVAGQAIYADNCSACHQASGEGIPRLFPALKGTGSAQSADPTTLIRVVLQGSQAVVTDAAPTAPAMPAFGWRLNDDQTAAVITYLRNSWGNAALPVRTGDVRSLRRTLSQRSD